MNLKPQSRPPTEWKPIESAPKQLEYILTACKSGYVTIDWVYVTARYNPYKSRWEHETGDALSSGGYYPKYWMPLPSPPEP